MTRGPIDEYVAAVRSGLRGRWNRRRVLAEIRDHLRESAERAEQQGVARAEAERRAVERFGDADSTRLLLKRRRSRAGPMCGLLVMALADAAGVLIRSQPGSGPPARTRSEMETVRVPTEGNSWIGAIVPRLHDAGLRVTVSVGWHASSFDGVGATIETPAVGTRVPMGTAVALTVHGILGTRKQMSGRYVVPGVVGATLLRAAADLQAAGLPWNVRASPLPPTATDDLYASYCIVAQHPAGGSSLLFPTKHGPMLVELAARGC